MKQNPLSEIFEKLSKKERQEIEKAINSPFFNEKNEVIRLWQCLEKGNSLEDKSQLFVLLFPDEAFNLKKIYTTAAILEQIIERVIQLLENENETAKQKIKLIAWYRKKGLNKFFQKNIAETQEILEDSGLADDYFYRTSHLIEQELYENHFSARSSDLNLQPFMDTLDLGFIIEKLKKTCFLLSQQAIFKVSYDTGLLKPILEYLKEKPELFEKPAIAVYYHCYIFQTEPNETAHFETFKRLIISYFSVFNSSEIRNLYLLAINYCIKQHNAGNAKYASEGLELFKKGLKDGFLLENGVLSRFSYLNIVAWALLEKNYEWTENFINAYKNTLERSYRDSMFSFCMARLEFSRKNYPAAILLLQKAEYRDILLGLAAKVILLKIYFELDEFDALESHLNSMKAYIIRKRVLGYHKINYQNIIKYTQKIIQTNGNLLKINVLREEISSEKILTEKEWLLEQLLRA
jgi:hypothetical protein